MPVGCVARYTLRASTVHNVHVCKGQVQQDSNSNKTNTNTKPHKHIPVGCYELAMSLYCIYKDGRLSKREPSVLWVVAEVAIDLLREQWIVSLALF
jgi:hypothetical protein